MTGASLLRVILMTTRRLVVQENRALFLVSFLICEEAVRPPDMVCTHRFGQGFREEKCNSRPVSVDDGYVGRWRDLKAANNARHSDVPRVNHLQETQ